MTELEEAALKLAMNAVRNDFRKSVPNQAAYSKDPAQIKLIKKAVTYHVYLRKKMGTVGYRSDQGAPGFYARFISPNWHKGGVLYKWAQANTQNIRDIMDRTLAGMNSYEEYTKIKSEAAPIPEEPAVEPNNSTKKNTTGGDAW